MDNAITAVASFVGVVLAAIYTYLKTKAPPKQEAPNSIQSIGVELGNRAQMEQMVSELRRQSDALEKLVVLFADRNQQAILERMGEFAEILERLDERERRERFR